MAIKYFDINRLVNVANGTYICFDDLIGVEVENNFVCVVYTTGGPIEVPYIPLGAFEAEVERSIRQTMSDQNENLNDFQNSLKEKIEELKIESLFNKTDKILSEN